MERRDRIKQKTEKNGIKTILLYGAQMHTRGIIKKILKNIRKIHYISGRKKDTNERWK